MIQDKNQKNPIDEFLYDFELNFTTKQDVNWFLDEFELQFEDIDCKEYTECIKKQAKELLNYLNNFVLNNIVSNDLELFSFISREIQKLQIRYSGLLR